MGWVWKGEPNDAAEATARDGDRCSTRKVVRSNCKTEEVEPGKFVRKCEKTEEVLRECVGSGLMTKDMHYWPVEVLQSNKEYTEEDVTEQMLKGNFSSGSHVEGAFDFPGLRNDLEAIEREFFGGVNRFFDAAEEMKNSFFDAFGDFHGRGSPSLPSARRGIPVEDHPQKKASPKPDESGHIDLSGLARDV